ncbi:MAG: FeoA domain-containing protein [Clostridia bacterium]|nr:FeoA domain-containing protein [Clostridia bacterium]MDR3643857.1 FeoA domain-containing protein [Clostridia bacterium]
MKNFFQPGNLLKVKAVNYDHQASKMLIDMGFTPDTLISVKNSAPFGEPLIIKIRNYTLALRKNDLLALDVELVSH